MTTAKKRIVITGVGVVAPNGIGKKEFWDNCFAGVSGIKKLSLFDTSKYRCRYAGEISDFQPERYLGPKGMRNLDRTTLLALIAAREALQDAQVSLANVGSVDLGVVVGTTLGSVHSISEFDKEGLREGPRYVDPGRFPNTVMNSPAGQVAIRFGIRGLNATIATGFTVGFDVLQYALDMLALGRVQQLLVGCVEELCPQTFLGFQKLGMLAGGSNGNQEVMQPFNLLRSGFLLGEGAVFFVLEPQDLAQARRGSKAYGELRAVVSAIVPSSGTGYDPMGRGLREAIGKSLQAARLSVDDIDCIASSANSSRPVDCIEAMALRRLFGKAHHHPIVSCVKSMVGETFSASSFLQIALGLGMIERSAIAPTLNSTCDDPACAGIAISNTTIKASVTHVLVTGLAPGGVGCAAVISGRDNN